jgi:hypothetical protein
LPHCASQLLPPPALEAATSTVGDIFVITDMEMMEGGDLQTWMEDVQAPFSPTAAPALHGTPFGTWRNNLGQVATFTIHVSGAACS